MPMRRMNFLAVFRAIPMAVVLTLGFLMACGGGGSSSSTPADTNPHITSFVASHSTITAGDTASLTAVFERGTGVVTPGNYPVTSGVPLTGTVDVTTTYTLTVTGASGTTPATATTTITAIPAPVISSFTATPSTIAAGDPVKLNAVFTGGTATVTPGNQVLTSGVDLTVNPLATTTYTLTVANSVGTQSATRQATVTVTGGGGGAQTISGTVTYDFVPAVYDLNTGVGGLDFASAAARPVRNGVVYMVEGTTILTQGATDAAGHYTLSYTPTGAGALQLVAMASSVTPSIIVQDNTASGGPSPWGIGAAVTAGMPTLNLHAPHGWTGTSYDPATRLAAPFAILDSLYTASHAFITVRPSVAFPELRVNWSPNNAPQAGDKALGQIGTSHFSPTENQIYILGKEGADTDEFDTHVMVHEWGHYFEKNLSRSDSPGGPHSSGDVLDPRLAFGEGYGNALAAMLLPESLYVDTVWSGGVLRAWGFDAETAPSPTDDPNPGPFSETTVMRLLYDIYDGGSSEAFDTVHASLGTIYDVLVGPEKTTEALTTIGSFVTGLKAQAGFDAAALDTLMAHYQIGPITTAWGGGDTNLSAMYAMVGSLPYSGSVSFDGGFDPNKWAQNQYFVVAGTGGTITVHTVCAQDVDIKVFQAGTVVGSVATTSGNETLQISTQASKNYVVVITGWGATPGAYPVQVSIAAP
jgi:hypothetical protein